MWVAALPVGVNGKQLNSTFQSRDTSAYKVYFCSIVNVLSHGEENTYQILV